MTKEKVARYVSGLRSSIQEEMTLIRVLTMEDSYQIALKIEERLNKKFENKQKGKGRGGKVGGRTYKSEENKQKGYKNEEGSNREAKYDEGKSSLGQNFIGRGRGCGFGGGPFRGTCFKCGEEGHRAYDCPHTEEKPRRRQEDKGREKNSNEEEDAPSSQSEDAEEGEVLMIRNTLLNDDYEPIQRKKLFKQGANVKEEYATLLWIVEA